MRRGGDQQSPLTLRFDVIHGGTRGLDGDLAGAGAPPRVVYRPQSEPGEAHEPTGPYGASYCACVE